MIENCGSPLVVTESAAEASQNSEERGTSSPAPDPRQAKPTASTKVDGSSHDEGTAQNSGDRKDPPDSSTTNQHHQVGGSKNLLTFRPNGVQPAAQEHVSPPPSSFLATRIGDDDEETKQDASGDDRSQATSSTSRRRKRHQPEHVVMIDSPRSALVLLRNGVAVKDIVTVDPQPFYNEALIHGTPFEMVRLRVAAEASRRKQRYDQLLTEYVKLCETVSQEEVMNAMRRKEFGVEVETKQNKMRLSKFMRFSYAGKADMSLLDEDCLKVLEASRGKALDAVRRAMVLHERRMQYVLDCEERAKQFTLEAVHDEQRKQERMKIQAEHIRKNDVSIQELKDRTKMLRERQEAEIEAKRQKLAEKERKHDDHAAVYLSATRSSSVSLIERAEERRTRIRDAAQEQERSRAETLKQKTDLLNRLHQRELERKQEIRERTRQETREWNDARKTAIKQLAELQEAERMSRIEQAMQQQEQRAEEHQQMRLEKMAARQREKEIRAERGRQSRQQAEEQRLARLEELEERCEQKVAYIQGTAEEKKKSQMLQQELARQSRAALLDDQQRVKRTSEFAALGCIEERKAKTGWLERESQKRVALTHQMKQEREALLRIRDTLLKQSEEETIRLRKEAFAKSVEARHAATAQSSKKQFDVTSSTN